MTKLTAELLDELELQANNGELCITQQLSIISAARASLESRGDTASGEVLEVGSTRGGKFKVTLTCSRDESKEWGQLLYKRVSASVVTRATCLPTEQVEHIHDPLTMGPRSTCGSCKKAAPSAAGAESMAGWVPVTERRHYHLEQGAKVLAHHPNWGVAEGWVNSVGSISGNWAGSDFATDWMPLPSPPKVTP